ncbi:hypothetical protein BLOT_005190 [Blomia tropicalis]|nr:hypothetical protein BLOT_005190 [Blomia tropicalis]
MKEREKEERKKHIKQIRLYRTNHVNVYNLVEQMRQAQPIIWWKAACYHHIRHTRPRDCNVCAFYGSPTSMDWKTSPSSILMLKSENGK